MFLKGILSARNYQSALSVFRVKTENVKFECSCTVRHLDLPDSALDLSIVLTSLNFCLENPREDDLAHLLGNLACSLKNSDNVFALVAPVLVRVRKFCYAPIVFEKWLECVLVLLDILSQQVDTSEYIHYIFVRVLDVGYLASKLLVSSPCHLLIKILGLARFRFIQSLSWPVFQLMRQTQCPLVWGACVQFTNSSPSLNIGPVLADFITEFYSKTRSEMRCLCYLKMVSAHETCWSLMKAFFLNELQPRRVPGTAIPPLPFSPMPNLDLNRILRQPNTSSLLDEVSEPIMAEFVNTFLRIILPPNESNVGLPEISMELSVLLDFFSNRKVPSFSPNILANLFLNRQQLPSKMVRLGKGQFGSVFRWDKRDGTCSAVKLVSCSKVSQVLSEAMALAACQEGFGCLHLISCGRTDNGDDFFLETPLYDSTGPTRDMLKQILLAVQAMHNKFDIVHYDLKSDNILVRENRIAIGDFGEAALHGCHQGRGTECIKSPEMLLAGKGQTRGRCEVGKPSDIWSLGCLIFEVIAGKQLFTDIDWGKFFLRVADPNGADPDRLAIFNSETLDKLGGDQKMFDFLKFILIRNPNRRPNIDAVIKKFDETFNND